MNSFRFRLQRVLDYRRMQLQLAENEFRRAEAHLQSVQARNAALEARKSETRKTFSHLPEVAGSQLSPLTSWFEWAQTEHGRLMSLERSAAAQLHKRRAALVDAQRNARLLERLHDHRKAQWDMEFEREMEQLASDSVNSRWAARPRTIMVAGGNNNGGETNTRGVPHRDAISDDQGRRGSDRIL